MTNQRFLREHHIRRTADYQGTYRRRCTAGDGMLLVFVCSNGLPHARLGLSVSRKVGGAVQRNRWKRLLREAFRMDRQKLPSGIDLVVIPRPDAEPCLRAVRRSLGALAHRAARKLARTEGIGRNPSAEAPLPSSTKDVPHGP